MRPGQLTAVAVAAVLCGAASPSPAQRADDVVDRAFAEYAAGDPSAIARIVPSRYFVSAVPNALTREVDAAISRWTRDPRPVHAVFLLELARYGIADVRELTGLEVLDRARTFLMRRSEPPGGNPRADAFEMEWHKTAFALVAGMGWPNALERHGLAPLRDRVAPAPSSGARLVDPWIELARAMLEEQRTIADPRLLRRRGPIAVERYDEAAQYAANRPEAVVRKSWVLARLGRHADALAVLGTLDDAQIADADVRYWSRLFRGRVLEGIGRADEAARAYQEALEIAPGAQAPAAALVAIDLQHGSYGAGVALGRARPIGTG